MTKRIFAVCCILSLMMATTALGIQPSNSAVSAVLIDCDSGRILYSKNPNEERLIASITKLMTALVAVESCPDLSQVVEIKEEWTGAEGSSLYLKSGEAMTLETLLYGLLLQSGNDAAVAIAGFCAGSVEEFVARMNLRASDLGMKHSHFQNPNGLNDENHYSTATDMAKLAMACMQNETIAKIVGSKTYAAEGRSFTNHNKLLWQYEYCVGMKTGYTQMAGRTLVTSARKNGQTLAVVTLSDPDDWKDHKALFEYGFDTFPKRTFVQAGDEPAYLSVEGSLKRSVPVYVKDSLSYPLSEGEEAELVVELPEQVSAPVKEGEIAGRISLVLGGKTLGSSYLLYGASATRDAVVANSGIRQFLDHVRGKRSEKLAFWPQVD